MTHCILMVVFVMLFIITCVLMMQPASRTNRIRRSEWVDLIDRLFEQHREYMREQEILDEVERIVMNSDSEDYSFY